MATVDPDTRSSLELKLELSSYLNTVLSFSTSSIRSASEIMRLTTLPVMLLYVILSTQSSLIVLAKNSADNAFVDIISEMYKACRECDADLWQRQMDLYNARISSIQHPAPPRSTSYVISDTTSSAELDEIVLQKYMVQENALSDKSCLELAAENYCSQNFIDFVENYNPEQRGQKRVKLSV